MTPSQKFLSLTVLLQMFISGALAGMLLAANGWITGGTYLASFFVFAYSLFGALRSRHSIMMFYSIFSLAWIGVSIVFLLLYLNVIEPKLPVTTTMVMGRILAADLEAMRQFRLVRVTTNNRNIRPNSYMWGSRERRFSLQPLGLCLRV